MTRDQLIVYEDDGSSLLVWEGGGAGSDRTLYTTPVQGPASVLGSVPIFDGTRYAVRPLTLDDLGPAFAITGFSGPASLVQVGATIASLGFTASYSSTPDSVTLSDGTHTATLTTPFTSATMPYSYTEGSYGATQSWTLTAVKGAVTKTSTLTTTWVQPAYYGIGAAGGSDGAFIVANLAPYLATSRARQFTVSPGAAQYSYFACKASYGAPTFAVGGFEGGLNLVSSSVSLNGDTYQLWVSAQPDLGSTTVEVS